MKKPKSNSGIGEAWRLVVSSEDPLLVYHELANELVEELFRGNGSWSFVDAKLDNTTAGKKIAALSRDEQVNLVAALLKQLEHLDNLADELQSRQLADTSAARIQHTDEWHDIWGRRMILFSALRSVLRKKLPFERSHVLALVKWMAGHTFVGPYWLPLPGGISAIQHYSAEHPVDQEMQSGIAKLAKKLRDTQWARECRKFAEQLEALLGQSPKLPIQPGEAWSDAALAELKGMTKEQRAAWTELLSHVQTASGGESHQEVDRHSAQAALRRNRETIQQARSGVVPTR